MGFLSYIPININYFMLTIIKDVEIFNVVAKCLEELLLYFSLGD